MIGIDILELERMKEKVNNNPNIIVKYLHEEEIEYIKSFKNNFERITGFFCLKEAVIKAFNGELVFKDILICHETCGKPYVKILKTKYKDSKIEVSISHSKSVAVAVAIRL